MSDSHRHDTARASLFGVLVVLLTTTVCAEACRVRSSSEGGLGGSSHTAARRSLDRACSGRSTGVDKADSCRTVLSVGLNCNTDDDECTNLRKSAADLEALLIKLESDAPALFEGPIGKFDGPKELFSELRNPKLDNYTTLLPPEGLAFSLRTAYELGDVIWRDSLRTVLLHVTRGTHNVPELVDMARQGRSVKTIGGEELTISMDQAQVVFTPRNLTRIPSRRNSTTSPDVYVRNRKMSCKVGSIVSSVSGLLGATTLNLRSVEYYRSTQRTVPKGEILIAAFVVACMLFVVVGGCVYGLLSSRCWVLLRLPVFSEGVGAQNSNRDRRQVASPLASAVLVTHKNVPEVPTGPVLTPPAVLYRVAAQLWSITHPNAAKSPKVSDEKPEKDVSEEEFPDDRESEDRAETESAANEEQLNREQSIEDLNALECVPCRASIEYAHSRSEADSCGLKHDHACVICMENEGDHVLLPCGHGGYCGDCAQKLLSRFPRSRLCPVCRALIGGFAKVSLATPIGAEGDVLETSFGEPVVVNASPTLESTP